MTGKKTAITSENFGAWVLKCNPSIWDLGEYLEMGGTDIDGWSLGRSYRLELMRAGQPVVFWVSGPLKGERTFRGIWGIGRLTSKAKWSNGLTPKEAR